MYFGYWLNMLADLFYSLASLWFALHRYRASWTERSSSLKELRVAQARRLLGP